MNDNLAGELQRTGFLPHQVELASTFLSLPAPVRVFLNSPVGTGKSIAVTAALVGLSTQRHTPLRILVIVPNSLQENWRAVLRKFGGFDASKIDAATYRRLQAESDVRYTPWETRDCVVTSLDYVKAIERRDEVLRADWDVVVIDEAHLCTSNTLRGKLARRLWESSNVQRAIAVSAHPDKPRWLLSAPATAIVRWRHKDLRNWDGEHLLPERDVEIVTFSLSESEKRFQEKFETALRGTGGGPGHNFLRTTLLRRWESSVYAIAQSLMRHAVKSSDGIRPEFEYPDDWTPPEPWSQELGDRESVLSPESARCLLELLEEIQEDTKWLTCESILESLIGKEGRRVVIFTDFADTAEYIGNRIADAGWKAFVVTSRETPKSRWKVIQEASETGDILVVTSAMTEGTSLSFSNQVIHYDLPDSPTRLLQRYGRVERIGPSFTVVRHYLLIGEDSATGRMLLRLTRKTSELEEEWLA